jgi:GH15 family glucan-1,4-alpha-glucosidase
VGTSAAAASKVWYTVAGGVLSDTYEPTIDNTNVSTLQYIVTNGSTFTDLQTRDMTYTVSADPTGMACTVTAADAQHGYRLTTTYITDPARDTVLMNTRLSAARTATGTATSRARRRVPPRVRRGRRPAPGPVICGRCCPASGPKATSPPGRAARPPGC